VWNAIARLKVLQIKVHVLPLKLILGNSRTNYVFR
jgi:hypothetical protein